MPQTQEQVHPHSRHSRQDYQAEDQPATKVVNRTAEADDDSEFYQEIDEQLESAQREQQDPTHIKKMRERGQLICQADAFRQSVLHDLGIRYQ